MRTSGESSTTHGSLSADRSLEVITDTAMVHLGHWARGYTALALRVAGLIDKRHAVNLVGCNHAAQPTALTPRSNTSLGTGPQENQALSYPRSRQPPQISMNSQIPSVAGTQYFA